jgi:hypothetical protein
MEVMKYAYKILITISERKGSLGTFTRRWENNIKVDVKEIKRQIMEWIHLVSNRVHWRENLLTG